MPFVLETIHLVRASVPRGAPLIGFAGGPFTLLCYLVCGRPSKEFGAARAFLYAQPESAQRLLQRLGDAMAAYLLRAGRCRCAGTDAVRVLGGPARARASSAGSRCRRCAARWRSHAAPACHSSITSTRVSALMQAVADLDVDVIGVDWRMALAQVRQILGPGKAVQGNLDPAALVCASAASCSAWPVR